MRMSVASLIALLFCACSLKPVARAQDAAQKKPGDVTIEPYVFQTDDGQEVDAEFGRLVVPENRNAPDTRLIELAFVRFKSTSDEPGPPIVYLAGGPGGSGIHAAQGVRSPVFMALREFGDVIALDQRGTGRSEPNLSCPENLDFSLEHPTDNAFFIDLLKAHARTCAAYWSEKGVDLTAYNTNESADDLDDLRKALGAEKLTLWGISYGTHLALAALKRHEAHIHRALLHGTEGPHHTLKIPAEIEAGFDELDAMIRHDTTLGAMLPSFSGLMRQMLDQLDAHPVTVEVVDPVTQEKTSATVGKFHLQLVTSFMLHNRQLMSNVPLFYLALSQGHYAPLAQSILAFKQEQISAMTNAMDCASGVSDTRWATIQQQESDALLGRGLDFLLPYVCAAWGIPDLGEAFRAPVHTDVPTLFISGTLDFRTPPGNAEEVRVGFSQSEHLIIEGAGHDDDLFVSSPSILEAIQAFLRDEPLPTKRITLPAITFRLP